MKNILIIIFCNIAVNGFAQNVGIGTNFPTEKLQVDSGAIKIGNAFWDSTQNHTLKFGDGNYVTIKENNGDDRMEIKAKDVVILPSDFGYSGNVGIGTTNIPTAKLEVNGAVKITDGTQGAGKVLTSNGVGLASWQTPVVPTAVNTLALKVCIALGGVFPSSSGGNASPDTYVGEIKIFPYNFVPAGWAECKGQILPIAQNAALFNLLGTLYGGNGTTTFALPNLTGIGIVGQ